MKKPLSYLEIEKVRATARLGFDIIVISLLRSNSLTSKYSFLLRFYFFRKKNGNRLRNQETCHIRCRKSEFPCDAALQYLRSHDAEVASVNRIIVASSSIWKTAETDAKLPALVSGIKNSSLKLFDVEDPSPNTVSWNPDPFFFY